MTTFRRCGEARLVAGNQAWRDGTWQIGEILHGVLAVPMTNPVKTFLDANGRPFSYGQLWSYAAGTQDLLPVYQDAEMTKEHTNPVDLDRNGQTTIFLGHSLYRFVLQSMAGYTQWEQDNVPGTIWPGVVSGWSQQTRGPGETAFGHWFQSKINKASRGTHALIAGTRVESMIVCRGGGSVVERAASWYISGPTGGTKNYALHVVGHVRLDEALMALGGKLGVLGDNGVATMGKVAVDVGQSGPLNPAQAGWIKFVKLPQSVGPLDFGKDVFAPYWV